MKEQMLNRKNYFNNDTYIYCTDFMMYFSFMKKEGKVCLTKKEIHKEEF